MSIILTREFLESVEAEAVHMLRDLEREIVAEMVDAKGLAYGDVELNRTERIWKFITDEQDGVNEVLKLSNPEEYHKRLREFQRDAQEAGLV